MEQKAQTYQKVTQPFAPVFDGQSTALILGSLPSVKSREGGFYYHHPQNRFWRILAALFEEPLPQSIPEKERLLLRHHLALWDVVQSCEIIGSKDSSIRQVVPADFSFLLSQAPIQKIYTNGQTASRLYRKYGLPVTGMRDVPLPSSSPANAAWHLDQLIVAWGQAILP